MTPRSSPSLGIPTVQIAAVHCTVWDVVRATRPQWSGSGDYLKMTMRIRMTKRTPMLMYMTAPL